jgi:hypothetical protein
VVEVSSSSVTVVVDPGLESSDEAHDTPTTSRAAATAVNIASIFLYID